MQRVRPAVGYRDDAVRGTGRWGDRPQCQRDRFVDTVLVVACGTCMDSLRGAVCAAAAARVSVHRHGVGLSTDESPQNAAGPGGVAADGSDSCVPRHGADAVVEGLGNVVPADRQVTAATGRGGADVQRSARY